MHKNCIGALIIIASAIVIISASYLIINAISYKGKIESISKAKSSITILGYSAYPDNPGEVKAVIWEIGPLGKKVPCELETKVRLKINGTYQVIFTEYWNSKDFKYAGSKDGTQSAYAIYEVSGNKVKFIKNGGDFPPEMVK